MVATSGRGWRLAPSLVALMAEVDARWPGRPTASDGSIGDAAHSARESQHNPDRDPDPMPAGYVSAVDITKMSVTQIEAIRRALIADPRVWYVIHDGRMWSRTKGFRATAYRGPNPHKGHLHVSLMQTATAANSTGPWGIAERPAPKPTPMDDPTSGQRPGDKHRPGSRALRWGDKGTDVALLQRFIGLPDDGIFGPVTAKGVRRYQAGRGDAPTGIVSARTWAPILRALGV